MSANTEFLRTEEDTLIDCTCLHHLPVGSLWSQGLLWSEVISSGSWSYQGSSPHLTKKNPKPKNLQWLVLFWGTSAKTFCNQAHHLKTSFFLFTVLQAPVIVLSHTGLSKPSYCQLHTFVQFYSCLKYLLGFSFVHLKTPGPTQFLDEFVPGTSSHSSVFHW